VGLDLRIGDCGDCCRGLVVYIWKVIIALVYEVVVSCRPRRRDFEAAGAFSRHPSALRGERAVRSFVPG
jgi:hypothetical protein